MMNKMDRLSFALLLCGYKRAAAHEESIPIHAGRLESLAKKKMTFLLPVPLNRRQTDVCPSPFSRTRNKAYHT